MVDRSRVVRLQMLPADELEGHDRNWRRHPDAQVEAIAASVDHLGWAMPIVAHERADGSLRIIDGHARATMAGSAVVPVAVTDLDDEEADQLLALGHPISDLADVDWSTFADLRDDVLAGLPDDLADVLDRLALPDLDDLDVPDLDDLVGGARTVICPACSHEFPPSLGADV